MVKNKSSIQVIVGMSGGVDSSVTAFLLKEAGYNVRGIFMKNWEEDDKDDYCPQAKDIADVKDVCDSLKIEFDTVNFSTEYWQHVFELFLQEYKKGRTPNPDILCNKEIKFKAFLHYAKQQGADFIATGHYVKKTQDARLAKAKDLEKDQSYFLYALSKDQIANSLFPLADLTKKEVREIAKKLGFKNHDKKDSTGICFIGERKFKAFLQNYLPAKPGLIETKDGEVIGKHDGLMFYTIGQRQGLCIGGKKGKAEAPWYVAAKDLKRNVLIVVQGEDASLYQTSLKAMNVHWIDSSTPKVKTIAAKTRYRQKDQPCHIENINDDDFLVTFTEPQRAITPGQSIVFYDHEICLGGGIIA